MQRVIENNMIKEFEEHLINEEKSEATIEKYIRDIRYFVSQIGNVELDKKNVIDYKNKLSESYAVTSANSMIAAINSFFRYFGWYDLCVKQYRIQKEAYCSENKELTRDEYYRLVEAAKRKNNKRLMLIIETICATGIRVSELKFITVEALVKGEAVVNCKGKNRRVFIAKDLKKKLLIYSQKSGIKSGCLFVTRQGNPINRVDVWKEMKKLCKLANVLQSKVFPHNLRHLFARAFYKIEKDIAKLADVLGHSNINTTRIYVVSTGNEHKKILEHMRLVI